MEFALAGWCLNYLIDLKGGTESCGYVLSAYYALFTLGRVALPKVNEAIGQERSLLIYLVICHLLAIGMWQFDNLVASAAMIVLFGLCIGVSRREGCTCNRVLLLADNGQSLQAQSELCCCPLSCALFPKSESSRPPGQTTRIAFRQLNESRCPSVKVRSLGFLGSFAMSGSAVRTTCWFSVL